MKTIHKLKFTRKENRIFLIPMIAALQLSTSSLAAQNREQIIPIADAFEHAQSAIPSDVFKNIEVVPLETSDDVFIGRAPKYAVTKDRVFVTYLKGLIYAFDRKTGKFLNVVGQRGQGPQEYLGPFIKFWADATTNDVYVNIAGRRFKKYNREGKYVSTIAIPQSVGLNLDFANVFINNGTIICHNKHVTASNNPVVFAFSGDDGTLLWKIAPTHPLLPTGLTSRPGFFEDFDPIYGSGCIVTKSMKDHDIAYNTPLTTPSIWYQDGQTYFKDCFNDTIYSIDRGKLKYQQQFSLGNKGLDFADRFKISKAEDRFTVNFVVENDQYRYFCVVSDIYNGEGDAYYGFYNKNNKDVRLYEAPHFHLAQYPDLTLRIEGVSLANEFFTILTAEEVIDLKEAGKKLPKELQAIQNEDANPVLIFMK